MGILFCYTSLSIASDNDNGRYSPAKVIPFVITIAGNFVTNIAINIISNTFMSKIKGNPTTQKKQTGYEFKSISHAQLHQDPHVQNTSKNLPESIKTTALISPNINSPKPHIHFTEESEANNKLLAQAIAHNTGSSYYEFKKDTLQPQLNLKKLQDDLSEIAANNKSAVVHFDFNYNELNKAIHSRQMAEAHNLYAGTLSQALDDLRKKHPNLRIITHDSKENRSLTVSDEKTSFDKRFEPIAFTCGKIFNQKEKPSATDKSFIVIDRLNLQSKNDIAACIALTLRNEHETSPSTSNWFWFWNKPIVDSITYNPTNISYVDSYFHSIVKNLSTQELNDSIKSARETKLASIKKQQPKTLTQYIAASLWLPREPKEITQFDILSEINDKKDIIKAQVIDEFLNKKGILIQPSAKTATFTPTKDLKCLLSNIPKTPTKKNCYSDDEFENEFINVPLRLPEQKINN